MIDKKHIESILRINGLGESAPDEQIRSVLLSASYNNDEVEAAMVVLRENTATSKTRVDGLHKVFRSDQALKASEISALLGIDIDVSEKVEGGVNARRYSLLHIIIIWFVSLLIATTGLIYYMYIQQTGFFHPASDLVFKK